MAVVWRVVALTVVVASCIGQVVPISFDEKLNRPRRRNEPCVETSFKKPLEGVCLPMQDCPLAMEFFNSRGQPMLATCGFEGVTRIVCCVKIERTRPSITPDGTVVAALEAAVDISPPTIDFECGERPFFQPFFSPLANDSLLTTAQPPASDAGYDDPNRHYVEEAIGGDNSLPNSWPWSALMGWSLPNGTIWWRCGAALINRQWVVTAAHCFDKGDPQVIRLGEHNYSSPVGPHRQDFKIRRYLLHPEYSIVSSYHDIALVELDRPVELKPEVAPVCLPWGVESNTNLRGRDLTLTGWGALQHGGDLSPVLQRVTLQAFRSSRCDTSYRVLPGFELEFPRGIGSADFLCAGDRSGGKDACKGDSGSPVTYVSLEPKIVLAGVVSKGYGCGLADFPGLYTPMHRWEYLGWIKKTAFT